MPRRFDAIVFERPGEIRVLPFELPPCGAEELVVETLYTFVSPGTELRVLAGTRESASRFPLIPGYSLVGRVVEVASIAWRAVTSAMPGPHDRAVVVGQGMLGSFATWWLLHFGAQVIVLDRVPERLERSRRCPGAARGRLCAELLP